MFGRYLPSSLRLWRLLVFPYDLLIISGAERVGLRPTSVADALLSTWVDCEIESPEWLSEWATIFCDLLAYVFLTPVIYYRNLPFCDILYLRVSCVWRNYRHLLCVWPVSSEFVAFYLLIYILLYLLNNRRRVAKWGMRRRSLRRPTSGADDWRSAGVVERVAAIVVGWVIYVGHMF